MEQWDAVIMGNDELLEKYMSGKPFKMSELEQEENRRFQNGTLFPVYHGSAKNNLGIRQLIEVIASKFYSSTPEGQSELCGHTFDQGIINLVKHSHDFLIGRQTAEVLRRNFNVFTGDSDAILSVAGRDLITGVPMRKPVSIMLIRAAMKDPLLECVKAIHSLLDRTPPEVRKAIYENGIFLTGGLANMPGLKFISNRW